MEYEKLLKPAAVAEMLSVSVSTLNLWRSIGEGPEYMKMGDFPNSPIRYSPAAVDEFKDNSVKTAGPY